MKGPIALSLGSLAYSLTNARAQDATRSQCWEVTVAQSASVFLHIARQVQRQNMVHGQATRSCFQAIDKSTWAAKLRNKLRWRLYFCDTFCQMFCNRKNFGGEHNATMSAFDINNFRRRRDLAPH
jgi:hypothetical protein